MSTLQFRIATPEDAPQLQQLIEATFRSEDSRKDWTADMALGRNFSMSLDSIVAKITGEDSAVLVADAGADKCVACVAAFFRRADNMARFAFLSVDQRYQRGGAGRKVLAHAEEYGRRTWGAGKAGLNAVSTRRELIAWYGRCGYRETGETSPFPVEAFPMLDLPGDLCFVEMEKDLAA